MIKSLITTALTLTLGLSLSSHAQKLTSSEAIPLITIPENSKLTIIGDHASHGIVSPTALTLDEQGNIFISETWRFMNNHGVDDNRGRRFWIPDDIASQTTSDRLKLYEKYYDRIKPEHYTQNAEKIRRIFDSNQDGTLDSSNLYADGFNNPLDGTAAGIFSYNGTTYFACIPNIWTLKDTNNDGIADQQTSLQEGFGVRVSYSGHDLNGFTLAPDGRIYATIGDRGINIKTKEGKHYVLPGQGAIMRFDPDGSNLEIVHTGLRNPKEIAFDQFGNGITVDNNSDQGDEARVVYFVDQADSGWRMGHQILHSFHNTIGLEKHPISRWMVEKMWHTENSDQPLNILPPIGNFTNGPSGLTYDPGVGAHPDYANKFLICDYKGAPTASFIQSFSIEPDGAGMKFLNPTKFNANVAATDIEYGYDGSVYVTDFIKGWHTHQQGRIYKITPDSPVNADKIDEVKTLISQGIENLPLAKLLPLLGHPDMRVRLRAQFTITELEDARSHFHTAIQQTQNRLMRLHGIWGLGMLARKNQDLQATAELITWATDQDPEVRAQAIKVLSEAPAHPDLKATLAAGLTDKSQRVSSFAALSIGRHPELLLENQVIDYIIASPADAHTRHSGVQALLAVSPDLTIPQRHSNEKVRLAAVLALRKQQDPALANSLNDANPKVWQAAIRAIHDQQLLDLQPAVAKLLDNTSLNKKLTPMMQRRLIHSAFRVGGQDNILRLTKFATDPTRDQEQRQEALRLLDIWLTPNPADQSLGKHAPLIRNPAENQLIKDTLASEIKNLLDSDSFVAEQAFHLIQSYQLDLPDMDETKLTALVQDSKISPPVRAKALDLLFTKSPDAGAAQAAKLTNHKNLPLVTQALKIVAKHAPESPQTHRALIRATKQPVAKLQQQAWPLFQGIQSEQTNKHLISSIHNLTDRAQEHLAAIEILDVAKTFLDPDVKAALKKYQRSYPKSEPLAKWLPALHGGDPVAGRLTFKNQGTAQCAKCHHTDYLTVHDGGGDAGPNLAGIAKRVHHLRKDLLEAIMIPDESIAPGFGTVTAEFEKGQVSGTILDYRPAGLVVQIGDAPRLISHSDYQSLSFSNSAMPSMKDKLTLKETRDVLAFLDSLEDEKGKHIVAAVEAKPFDLNEVKTDAQIKEMPLAQRQKQLYEMNCMACHQPSGEGNETFPPLAGSEWVSGDKETLIKMQLLGLTGPIKVKGKVYDTIAMPSNARLSDDDLANILTYIRTNPDWNNNSTPITTEEVAKVRKELGNTTTPLDATTLPHPETTNLATTQSEEKAFTPHKANKTTGILPYILLILIACLIPVTIGFIKNK
ncbi:MAG: DUF7133 domain-containing protein [Akkermansiaceae bacterium]